MTRPVPIEHLAFDAQTGCVTALVWAGGTVPVESWGCEFGNWHGFFSQARMGGTAVEVRRRQVVGGPQEVTARFDVAYPGGTFRFTGREMLADGRLQRRYELEALERSTLGDFVVRLGAAASRWPEARLGDRRLDHRNRNRMVLLPERTARLVGPDLHLVSTLAAVDCPDSLDVLTYVRDEPGGLWIVHHRLLTRDGACDEYAFRFWRGTWSSYDHSWLRWKLMRRLFWRLAERRPGLIRATIQVGGNIALDAGTRLRMESVAHLEAAGGPQGA